MHQKDCALYAGLLSMQQRPTTPCGLPLPPTTKAIAEQMRVLEHCSVTAGVAEALLLVGIWDPIWLTRRI